MIKNIIFDLAGVILNLNIERDTEALHAIGLPDYMGCLARPEICNPACAYLNGLTSAQVMCDAIRPYCRPDVRDEEIIDAMDAVLDDIPRSRLELLVELRQRYRIFLLSNLYETAWDHTLREFERNGFTPEQCFEEVFLSYELGLAKPDLRIFQHVIQKTGIDPAETLYLDDTRENVDGGQAAGLHAHLVPMNQLESLLPELNL